MAHDLQVAEPANQRDDQDSDHQHGGERALREDALLVPLIFDTHL
jgi:hypothetical protein